MAAAIKKGNKNVVEIAKESDGIALYEYIISEQEEKIGELLEPKKLGVVTEAGFRKLSYVDNNGLENSVLCKAGNNLGSCFKTTGMIAKTDGHGKIHLFSHKPISTEVALRLFANGIQKQKLDEIISWFNSYNTKRIPEIENSPIRTFKVLRRPMYKYQYTDIIYMREFEKQGITFSIPAKFVDLIGNIIDCSHVVPEYAFESKLHGGILANEAGTGKTMTSLVHSVLHNAISRESLVGMKKNRYGLPIVDGKILSRATLFITQNQILGQWKNEVTDIFNPEYNIKTYVIKDKIGWEKLNAEKISDADIIITSYSFFKGQAYKNLAITFDDVEEISDKKEYVSLSCFHFNRIVLDEYQKEYSKQILHWKFKGTPFDALSGNYRWILSATPFTNADSVFECLHFLSPEKIRLRKVCSKNSHYLNFADTVIKKCTLRVTKKILSSEINLPKVNMNVVKIKMTDKEKRIYNAIKNKYHSNYRAAEQLLHFCICPNLDHEAGVDMFQTIEEIEAKLLKSHVDEAEKLQKSIKKLKKDIEELELVLSAFDEKDPQAIEVKNELGGKKRSLTSKENKLIKAENFIKFIKSSLEGKQDDSEMCDICCVEYDDKVNRRAITSCGHCFCQGCMEHVLAKNLVCPKCRQQINRKTVYYVSDSKKFNEDSQRMGSKMAKILHYLVEKIKNTSGNILLFCIWDSICKKIIEELANNGIKSLFLQGTTSTKERTLQLFNNPKSEYRLMSLSTKWSAEGTNLTRADMVVFVDPIHGSKEDRRNKMLQAISRSHRIGQKNDVEVVMFVMEDTVESETIQDETFEFINDLNVSEKKN